MAGFTLIELLVVIGVLGLLIGLTIPAVLRSLESGRAATCRQNLRSLSLSAIQYAQQHGRFPGGVDQSLFNDAPLYRGTTLFVRLLPYLDQQSLAKNWDLVDPMKNTDGGAGARTAVVIRGLICPSDQLPSLYGIDNRWTYALSSYGGNGGTRSYFPTAAMNDGMFHTTGSASEPTPNQQPVSSADVRDGIERTVLFGERYHEDPDYDYFALGRGWGPPVATWGWWAAAGGRRSIGHVTLAAAAPINYRHPTIYDPGMFKGGPVAPPVDFAYRSDLRLTAYGSGHPGGANFAFVGGNVEFLSQDTSLTVLQSMCTRAGDGVK